MQSHPYTLRILYEELEAGNELKAIVNSNGEEIPLKIVVTIHSTYGRDRVHTGFRASAEFFEGNNRIDNFASIVKNERFWSLIEYYQKEIVALSSKKQLILTDIEDAQEPESTIKQSANFATKLVRSIDLRKHFKLDGKFTSGLLLGFQSFCQGLNVYTLCTSSKDTEIIIACTSIGVSADMTTYINSNLFYDKLAVRLIYLHLGNVILATQLISRQIRDLTSRIENVTSYTRRRALPYSLVIAAIHFFSAYYIYCMTPIQASCLTTGNIFGILVAPLIWPTTAFFVRMYAPRIISHIVRYAINRILRS